MMIPPEFDRANRARRKLIRSENMEKLNYIETRIDTIKERIKYHEERPILMYHGSYIEADLKKELTILESIRDDYKVKV